MTDEFAVMQIVYRYVQYYDDRKVEAIIDLHTEDCVTEMVGYPVGGRFEGKQGLRSMITGGSGQDDWPPRYFAGTRGMRHLCTNPVIVIRGDEALCSSDFHIVSLGDPASTQNPGGMVGRYYDHLKRVNGEWKIAHRRFNALIPNVPQAYNPSPTGAYQGPSQPSEEHPAQNIDAWR